VQRAAVGVAAAAAGITDEEKVDEIFNELLLTTAMSRVGDVTGASLGDLLRAAREEREERGENCVAGGARRWRFSCVMSPVFISTNI
jgi:hypothetical protein